MKIRQPLLAPVGLSVLLALAWTAGAQEAATTDAMATDAMATDTVVGPSTGTLSTSSASAVSIKGIVSGQPESVSFSGQAQIISRLVRDPDFGHPVLLLTINLGSVSGVGSSTNASYVIPSQGSVQRHLAPSHELEITFPFMKSGSTDASSARTGVASFALSFDTSTGEVTSAKGKVGSPSF
jgi:hypothetical protein